MEQYIEQDDKKVGDEDIAEDLIEN